MKKIGLVLSGGGGKGAYQVGVWKALNEFKVDKYINSIAGTSVGALNALLFATKDYQDIENCWKSISPETVLFWDPQKIIQGLTSRAVLPASLISNISALIYLTAGWGWFSQKGLEELIHDNLDVKRLQNSIPVHVCATNIDNIKACYQQINQISKEEITKWLMASAAIPIVFSPVEINGSRYYDGCIMDNLPIGEVSAYQPDLIIASHLQNNALTDDVNNKAGSTSIWHIIPDEQVGGLIKGSLNFTQETIEKLILAGYNETCKILQDIHNIMLSEASYSEKLDMISGQDKSFKTLVSDNQLIRKQIEDLHMLDQVAEMNSLEYFLKYDSNKHMIEESKSIVIVNREMEKQLHEAEKLVIDDAIDKLISEQKKGSEELINVAFEGITVLASTSGRIKHMRKQGFWSRLWNNLTGKNQKMNADIQNDMNTAIYANQQLIKKLLERNVFTMDMIISLNNKINLTMTHVNNLYQGVSILAQAFMNLKNMTAYAISELDKKINQNRESIEVNSKRIGKVENMLEITTWRLSLRDRYANFSKIERVHYFLMDFWNLPAEKYEMPASYYRTAMRDLCLHEEKVSIGEHISFMSSAKQEQNELCRFLEKPTSEIQNHPVLIPFQRNCDNEEINEKYLIDVKTKLSAIDYLSQLIYLMKSYYEMKKSSESKRLKQLYNDKLLRFEDILKTNECAEIFIEKSMKLRNIIQNFVLKVPLIGRFSAGKSRLLNAYLEQNILEWSDSPTTAIATELKYGERERIVIHYEKNTKQLEIGDIRQLNTHFADARYIEIYLDNVNLKSNPDIVFVDMPGIDSNNMQHTKAVANYVSDGHYFIAVASPLDSFNDSFLEFIDEFANYEYDSFSFIITRKKVAPEIEEIKAKLSEILKERYETEIFVGATEVSKIGVDIADFEKCVKMASSMYETIFVSNFKGELDDLFVSAIHYIINNLKGSNLCLTKLNSSIEEIENLFEKEKASYERTLLEIERDITTAAVNEIMNDVTNAITTNSSQLTASLQSGSAQIFIENVVRPIIINGFKNVEQRVTTKVNSKLNAIRGTIEDKFDELLGKSNIELNIDLDLSVGDAPQNNLNPTHKTLNNPMLLGAGLGLLKGNPILVIAGVLIGKIISLSGKENSEDSKLQQKIHQDIIPNAIQSVTSSVKTQAMAFYENIKINFAGAFEELQKEKLENLEELKKEKESSELEIETKISNWQKAIDEIKMLME